MILKRAVRVLLITLFAAVLLLGQRWYSYVTNTASPYDEVGIELNGYMPYPIRKWGCDKLQATFGNTTIPPHGCQADGSNGKQWI